ncbi:MAG: ExbD/TolR family protein [Akkermansiaceae bacterium]
MARRSRKKKRKAIPVPIASMGDIAFLLIIFFLVCSEVSKDRTDLEVTLPFSEYVEKTKAQVVARISVDKIGDIYFDGTLVDSAKDVEWGVRALLTDTVSDDQRHVQFKCDSQLPKEVFEPVLKAIAAGGGIIEAVGEKNE